MCFNRLIGIKYNCENETPTSGLYVDDFGISLNELDQLITASYSSGFDLFKAKRAAAGEILSSEIQAKTAHWMVADKVIDTGKIGFLPAYSSGYVPALGAGKFVGATMKLDAKGSFVNVFISNILISAKVNVELPLYVVDLYTNNVLETYQVNTNELTQIDLTLYSNRNDLWVAVLYEATEDFIPTLVKEGYCGSCGGGNAEVYTCRNILTQGYKGEIFSGQMTSGEPYANTGGLQINYAVNCDYSAWVCSNSKQFALAHIFKTNAEIMQFALFESVNIRANTTVTINTEVLEQRYNYFQAQYEKQMNLVLQNMAMPSDANCFRCRQNVRWSTMLP